MADPFHIGELVDEAIAFIRPLLAEFVQGVPDRLPALADVEITAREGPPPRVTFRFHSGECLTAAPRDLPPRQYYPELRRACRSLYSRLYEDERMRRQLAPRRDMIRHLLDAGHDQAALQEMRDLAATEDHWRRYHRRQEERAFFGVDLGRDEITALTATQAAESREGLIAAGRAAMEEMVRTFAVPPALLRDQREALRDFMVFGSGFWIIDDPGADPKAEERGLTLLKAWLTPEQLASYEKHKHFEVIGSATGKRYRIKHGRQMNIDELDAKGRVVGGICFLPEGQLVAGDCMLAQKIALETNENAALKVANRFPNGPSMPDIDLRPGALNYIDARGWMAV